MTALAHIGSRIEAAPFVASLDAALADTTSLTERVRLIRAAITGRIAFSTSLGIEDQALLHAIAESGADIDVFTLDTGRHFAETLETIATSEARYGLRIRIVAPDAREVETLVARDGVLGFRASIEARKGCCEVRKVRPLNRALEGASAWITGLRRGQSNGRGEIPLAEHDALNDRIKLAPLADWSLEKIETFVESNSVPVNPLHARGFPSIGCQPCTRAILPGEDIRAGRWWWESEDGKECGLHAPKRRMSAATA